MTSNLRVQLTEDDEGRVIPQPLDSLLGFNFDGLQERVICRILHTEHLAT